MRRAKLSISAGERTEDVLQELLSEFSDEVLDEVDVDREMPLGEGLATEPITVSVVLVVSPIVLLALVRAIDRYVEGRMALQSARVIIEAHEKDPELVKVVQSILKKRPKWTVRFGKVLEVKVDNVD